LDFPRLVRCCPERRHLLAPPAYQSPLPPPLPGPDWTGCNANAGYGYGLNNVDNNAETFPGLVPITSTGTEGGRGWLGRFGGGCDYQFGINGLGNWVVGPFADYDVMDIHGNLVPETVLSGEAKETSVWYAGGRIGYLVTPNLLTYFDGGYTQTHFDGINFFSTTTGAFSSTSSANTFNGWFLGGGTEYALNFSWLPIHGLFWRNEYRFASYSSADIPATAPGGAVLFASRMTPYVETLTSSLVWRFDWTGH
jgi:outer membrane immunogenic protein